VKAAAEGSAGKIPADATRRQHFPVIIGVGWRAGPVDSRLAWRAGLFKVGDEVFHKARKALYTPIGAVRAENVATSPGE